LSARELDRRSRALSTVRPFAHLHPFEPRFLEQGEGALHYVDEGPRDAEPILCVHGNPTWSFYWRSIVSACRDRWRVIALDHLGCGLSDKHSGARYDLASHVERLERFVLELDLSRITLVVHDWGGAIGMGAALRHPERIARIVITNTAAFPADRMPLRIALARTPVIGQLAVQGFNAFARAATYMAVEHPLPEEVRRAYLAPYASWSERRAIWRFVRDIPMSAGDPSFATLQSIGSGLRRFTSTPASILWGERDWCFTPRFRLMWQERWPHAEVHRFDDAGHWVCEDAGERVVRALREWLARTPVAAEARAEPARAVLRSRRSPRARTSRACSRRGVAGRRAAIAVAGRRLARSVPRARARATHRCRSAVHGVRQAIALLFVRPTSSSWRHVRALPAQRRSRHADQAWSSSLACIARVEPSVLAVSREHSSPPAMASAVRELRLSRSGEALLERPDARDDRARRARAPRVRGHRRERRRGHPLHVGEHRPAKGSALHARELLGADRRVARAVRFRSG
jgi:haloalkane dehalogenase